MLVSLSHRFTRSYTLFPSSFARFTHRKKIHQSHVMSEMSTVVNGLDETSVNGGIEKKYPTEMTEDERYLFV